MGAHLLNAEAARARTMLPDLAIVLLNGPRVTILDGEVVMHFELTISSMKVTTIVFCFTRIVDLT